MTNADQGGLEARVGEVRGRKGGVAIDEIREFQ